MEYAASSQFCLQKNMEQMLEEIKGFKTRNIEVCDSEPHALNPERVKKLLEHQAPYGTRYSVHAPYADTNLIADDPSIREAVLKRLEVSLELSSDLGARSWVFHSGWLVVESMGDPNQNLRYLRGLS